MSLTIGFVQYILNVQYNGTFSCFGCNFSVLCHLISSKFVACFILTNSADPDEMPPYAAFHLGLHCLPKTFLSVSRMKRVNLHFRGGLFGKFGKKKDKSPAGRRISEVDEEQSESISDKTESVLQRNSERRSNQSLNSVEKNSALTGSKSDSGSLRSDNSAGSLKSEHSGSSLKSNTFDNVKDSVNEIDKEAVDDKDDKEDKTESGTEEGETEEDELDDEEEVEKVPEKKPLELPKVRKSVEKTSEVKKESENGHVEHEDDSVKKVEEDEKETVKEESNSTEKVSEGMVHHFLFEHLSPMEFPTLINWTRVHFHFKFVE